MKPTSEALHCKEDLRREDVRMADMNGLDYLEVADEAQRTLLVYFLGKAPPVFQAGNLRISGGQRVRDIAVTGIEIIRQPDPALDDVMEVRVDKPGDFSTYVLRVVEADEHGRPTDTPLQGFDTRYDRIAFSFKASCPSDLDCLPRLDCPPPPRPEPDINYLAKDYASFRQLILDRLALIMPDWREDHAPDLGIALVELLAYAGDYLSYYQDAVATEAYLGTARQRISVRRHARLVDYRMHEGCNARAWLVLETDTERTLDLTAMRFITAYPGAPRERRVLAERDLLNIPAKDYEIFEALPLNDKTAATFRPAHNRITIYTWGDSECCLARGATSATLLDAWADDGAAGEDGVSTLAAPDERPRMLKLAAGDVLIFEEVIGPRTGNPADADPNHRQAVRLTDVAPAVDALYNRPVLNISWGPADALAFPLCLSIQAPAPDCAMLPEVSVARGNVILVDHGTRIGEPLGTVPLGRTAASCPTDCDAAEEAVLAAPFRPRLSQGPLTFAQAVCDDSPASDLLRQDPREALPSVVLDAIPAAPGGSEALFAFADLQDPTLLAAALRSPVSAAKDALLARLAHATRAALANWSGSAPLPAPLLQALVADLTALIDVWRPVSDLLDSADGARALAVEIDNEGLPHLRFSTSSGPGPGILFAARYRVGNGSAGNVGAETITYLVPRGITIDGAALAPRNPMAASGGTEPEPLEQVKLLAPDAFRSRLARAVTAQDYAALAARHPAVQRAAATLRWTGSWHEVLVAVDPLGGGDASPALLDAIAAALLPYRRIGHDLVVRPARYVPLDIELRVCVAPHYLRGQVKAALLEALDSRAGFFHPDRLSFGDDIHVSTLTAAAQAVPGVREVAVVRLERYFEGPNDELRDGVLHLGPLEIARLDNHPGMPENGRLVLDLRGGR
ncbi:putative baseplate assembly protein [Pseudoduganella sp. HUAS MS19]